MLRVHLPAFIPKECVFVGHFQLNLTKRQISNINSCLHVLQKYQRTEKSAPIKRLVSHVIRHQIPY